MILIYRGSKDGRNFHKKYDNKGEKITLIKNEKGKNFWSICFYSLYK